MGCSGRGLTEADLSKIILQSWDLRGPYGVQRGSVALPAGLQGLPEFQVAAFHPILDVVNPSGGVGVFFYADEAARESAYLLMTESMPRGAEAFDLAGEKGMIWHDAFAGETALVFMRCRGVVHIQMTGTADPSAVIDYGIRLDAGLKKAVCR
jgi:hypothetical protein